MSAADKEEELNTLMKSTMGKMSHQIGSVSELKKVETPLLMRTVNSHPKKVYCAKWKEDSQTIVTAGQEGNVLLTDASLNVIVAKPIKCKFVMQCAAYKNLVACGGMNNLVELHKTEDASEYKCMKQMEGHEGYISSLDFIEDGRKLLTGSGDGYAKIWDVEKKCEMQSFHGHEQDVSGISILGPDQKVFTTCSTDKTVRLWDMRTEFAVRKFKTKYGANCCAMMPNNAGILAGCDNASWEFFDVVGNNQAARGKVKKGRCESIAVSASGRFTYMGWDTGDMTIADTFIPDNQKCIANGGDSKASAAAEKTKAGKGCHDHSICSLAISPDGSALLSSSFDCTAKVWGARS